MPSGSFAAGRFACVQDVSGILTRCMVSGHFYITAPGVGTVRYWSKGSTLTSVEEKLAHGPVMRHEPLPGRAFVETASR